MMFRISSRIAPVSPIHRTNLTRKRVRDLSDDLSNGSTGHLESDLEFIDYAPAAFFASFLLIFSSAYLTPLPLYGSGGLNALISAAT